MDRRDAAPGLRAPIGWLALLVVAVLAGAEALAHQEIEGATVPWWHLGVAAGFVIWGRWRMLPWVVAGSILGRATLVFGSLLLLRNDDGQPLDLVVVTVHLIITLVLPFMEAVGLVAMLFLLGRHRESIVSGMVELADAMRLVGVAIPAALVPALLLLLGVMMATDGPLLEAPVRVIAGGFTGLVTAAPITIALLPAACGGQTYRCHCQKPAVPMIAMALLVPIGLMPSIPGSDPIQSMTLMSLAAMGILGWLSLASGWMATSMGMLMLGLAVWGSGSFMSSPIRLATAVELLLLSPAFVIGLLFASTMETRFRDRARLADRHDELRTILDATGAALLRVDRSGRVEVANAAALDLRPDAEPRIGEPLEAWTGERAAPRIRKALQSSRQELEVDIPRGDRPTRYQVLLSPLLDDRGEVRGHTIVIVDLSHRLQREATRRRRERQEYTNLAAACLHEVNSISMAVGGAAILARESCHDTTVGRFVDEIERTCDDAARRAERLRHLARTSEIGESIDLGRIATERLDAAVAAGRVTSGMRRIQPGGFVRIERGFARFVIDEFIQNAVDAARSGRPRIDLSLRIDPETDRAVVLEFADDGPGIPEALRTRIGRVLTSPKGQGRGLGLAAVLAGARRAGGDLSIETGDRGTTMRLALPIVTEEPATGHATSRPTSAAAG